MFESKTKPVVCLQQCQVYHENIEENKQCSGAVQLKKRNWRLLQCPAFVTVPVTLTGDFEKFMVFLSLTGIWGQENALCMRNQFS